MRAARRRPLVMVSAGVVLVAAVVATGVTGARAEGHRAAAMRTLHLVEKGGGIAFIDNPPKAKHQFDFSAGDIVIVSRDLVTASGGHAGSLRLTCIATTATTQQCAGTETLAGGTLELSGVSSPAPSTTVAVTGGTGLYAGAHGTSVSTDRRNNPDIADQTIGLLG